MSAGTTYGRWMTPALSAGIAVLFLAADTGSYNAWMAATTWAAICVAAGALWHRAADEFTPISMTPAAHFAAAVVLAPPVALGVIAGSSLLGGWIWRRESLRTILPEAGASVLGGLGALATLLVLGSWISPASLAQDPRGFLTIAAAGMVWLGLYQAAMALAAARVRRVGWARAWGDAFGRETGLVTTGALLTVATLAVFGAQTLGLRGILLAAMPALFVRDGSRRNIELEVAQRRLIKNERLAAKGEMAAEIGHELNNYLAAISGRAQLLLRRLEGDSEAPLRSEAERVQALAMAMAEPARGLMESSRQGSRRTSVGVNELVEKTVDFIKPHKKFRNLEFRLEPDPAVPKVEMDPGQIQQVLLILLARAAESPGIRSARILDVRTQGQPDRTVRIDIGTPGAEVRGEAPDAPDGESTIDTARRILERHEGRLEWYADPGAEGSFRVVLPAA